MEILTMKQYEKTQSPEALAPDETLHDIGGVALLATLEGGTAPNPLEYPGDGYTIHGIDQVEAFANDSTVNPSPTDTLEEQGIVPQDSEVQRIEESSDSAVLLETLEEIESYFSVLQTQALIAAGMPLPGLNPTPRAHSKGRLV